MLLSTNTTDVTYRVPGEFDRLDSARIIAYGILAFHDADFIQNSNKRNTYRKQWWSIHRMHDHKGDLHVFSIQELGDTVQYAILVGWRRQCECNVYFHLEKLIDDNLRAHDVDLNNWYAEKHTG